MGSRDKRRLIARKTSFETLESRQMFSAEPVSAALGGALGSQADQNPLPALHAAPLGAPPADFWLDPKSERDPDQVVGNVEQQPANADVLTGLAQVRKDYGFTGAGQTVAIIDSGIAYDHAALGGGLGTSYRVVGGWDFTEENDANPYDDGPLGGHGTHVAGIVGGDRAGTADDGVAPGVDLVGLRVFNDAGNSYFSWIENALKWVHENRNSFSSPITAVNLSIGAAWNATTVPSWSTLEDEFALLASDGIFISVSAGNSFATYNTPGLSYPAASPNVVPVMSVDSNGSLSSFSQRQARAIAAPGRYIVSTVPDYAGNHNGVTDDYASYSGTSMAAPYVAGASVLVREAMQFVGYTNITEWTIYNHMMATADTIFDAATSQSYKRLNLEKAIDALMPADEYGSSVVDAFNLGTLNGTSQLAGVIGKLDDADYFRFTAGASGTVTFTANTMDEMQAKWTGSGAVGGTNGRMFTMQVTAGQTYTVGLASAAGLGHYTVSADLKSAFSYNDVGTVTQLQVNGTSIAGGKWYKVKASQAGWITAAAAYDAASGGVHVAWYDMNMQRLVDSTDAQGVSRVDRRVDRGDELFLYVEGSNGNVDLKLTNLVSVDGSTVAVTGTSGDDTYAFAASGPQYTLKVNGTTYQLDKNTTTTVNIAGGAGNDSITMSGSSSEDVATLRVGNVQLVGSGYAVVAKDVENVMVVGGANDQALLYDSSGNDVFTGWSDHATLAGNGYRDEVRGFGKVTAYATTGTDSAVFYDSNSADTYAAWSNRATMYNGSSYFNDARGFDSTLAIATAGTDRAVFYDTTGDDNFTAWSDRATMSGSGYANEARGFDSQTAYATKGADTATFYDSAGNDTFAAWADRAVMYQGAKYSNDARGFDTTLAVATSGTDRAVFYDTAGNEEFTAWPDHARLVGAGFANEARGFDSNTANATTGIDTAKFYDSSGADTFAAWSDRAVMYDGSTYSNEARGFDSATASSRFGNDRAVLYDTAGDDVYAAWPDRASMSGAGYVNSVSGFQRTYAYTTTGFDQAQLYDSDDDTLSLTSWGAYLMGMSGYREARGFDRITTEKINDGNESAMVQAVDYLFLLAGDRK